MFQKFRERTQKYNLLQMENILNNNNLTRNVKQIAFLFKEEDI